MTVLHDHQHTDVEWVAVCPVDRLTPDRGVAALVHGVPIAIFLLSSGDVHAVDNIDPRCGASVMSRGLVGDVDGRSVVASPMYKHRFDLETGVCLDDDGFTLAVHRAAVVDGMIAVRLGPRR